MTGTTSPRQADVVARLRALLVGEPVRELSMFGGLSFMVGDKMLANVRKDGDLLLRVDADRHDELVAHPGAAQAEMGPGRQMGPGWITVSSAAVADDEGLTFWTDVALQHNRSATGRTA